MLKVENINVYYGAIHALKGISVEVKQGEIVTLIGANGAGKSTTLNSIMGLVKSGPRSSISWNGQEMRGAGTKSIVESGIVLVPEGRRVFPNLSVDENLTLGAYARKHVPWANFANVPPSASMPLSAFAIGSLPTVSFVVPDLSDDMHDGSIASADNWLSAHLAGYANWARANNSLLIVTWDEDDDSADNRIPTIFYGAGVKPGRYSQTISHYNVLSTIQEMYGLPRTGLAASAPPVTGIWLT